VYKTLKELAESECKGFLIISDRIIDNKEMLERAVVYRPKTLVVGVGLHWDTTKDTIKEGLEFCFNKFSLSPKSIARFASIKKEELQYICEKVKLRGNYYFSDYCFLEVVPPYIADGIKKCLSQNIDALTIIPYFLYPGRKVKAAVNTAVRLQSQTGVKFTISRP